MENSKIKKVFRLSAVWTVKILFGHSHFKVPFFKRVFFAINGGFMPDQVVLYNLNKNKRKEYLSEFDWYKSRYINGKYGKILDNKLICGDILKQYVDIPKVIFIKKDSVISSYDSKSIKYEDILMELKKQDLYIKPISAGKGNGVNRLSFKNNKYYIDFKEINERELIESLKKRNNWFLSECVNQAKFLNDIYDKTTNTIRIISIRDKNTNECKIINAVQRIGTKETIPVDNGSRGGLVAKIDIDSGILTKAKSIQKICEYEKHPDSKNQIEGVVVPNWEKVKKKIVLLMEKIPYIYFVAWDVLLTEKGFTIIEANSSSGVNIIQLWGGQRNKDLGKFFKTHKVIK